MPTPTHLSRLAHYLPDEVIDNEFFESILDTSDAWIRERVGIAERRFMGDYRGSFPVFEIGRRAVTHLMDQGGLDLGEIDLIISCSSTDDLAYPGPANMLSEYFGLKVPAFHMKNGCSSLLYGIQAARGMLQLGSYRNVLLVCGEPFTVQADYAERSSSILFGDASAAAVLSTDGGGLLIEDVALGGQGCTSAINATGAGAVPARSVHDAHGVSGRENAFFNDREPRSGCFSQRGREVVRFVVDIMPDEILSFVHRAGMTVDEIDYFIGHQSNLRMLESLCEKLGFTPEKHLTNIERCGNTASAGWATVLSEALDAGKIAAGQRVLVSAYGAGLAWGHLLARRL
jgi:3-oxoacyl-[acyl-carrier-protein] synthase-3